MRWWRWREEDTCEFVSTAVKSPPVAGRLAVGRECWRRPDGRWPSGSAVLDPGVVKSLATGLPNPQVHMSIPGCSGVCHRNNPPNRLAIGWPGLNDNRCSSLSLTCCVCVTGDVSSGDPTRCQTSRGRSGVSVSDCCSDSGPLIPRRAILRSRYPNCVDFGFDDSSCRSQIN